jgi:single-strand DNA-binding protein
MSLNKVMLIGNLGRDPEVKYTPNQTAVCTLNIATSDRRKDDTGNWVEQTEWHRVVVFGKTAENCGQYLKKGRSVYIEGRLRTNKWKDKEGNDRYTTEIVAGTVQFLSQGAGGGRDSGAGSFTNDSFEGGSTGAPDVDIKFDDDDIPF